MKVYSISKLVKSYGIEIVQTLIQTYKCEKDIDIENFLYEKSVVYEQQNISRTYLIIDFNESKAFLLAYFTIAIKEFQFQKNLSRTNKKRYLGTSFEVNNQLSAILIGQLGKNSAIPKDKQITGTELMNCILEVISKIREYAGGRLVYVEAKNHKFLHSYYTSLHFLPYHDEDGSFIKSKQGLIMYLMPSPKCF